MDGSGEPSYGRMDLIARFSLLMFIQFAVLGAWAPVASRHFEMLGLSPSAISLVFSTSALGALLAPLPWSQIADRWLSAERCISICSAVSGILLWRLASVRGEVELFWMFLAVWLFVMPIFSLVPAVTFRHMSHPEQQFGFIRMWGTIGWMFASWLVTGWFLLRRDGGDRDWADAFRLGAVFSWILCVYALTLPNTPPLKPTVRHDSLWRRAIDAPLLALKLFRIPAFVVYCFCYFGLYVSWPFNMQMTAPSIKNAMFELGMGEPWLPVIMTIAQITEVATLAWLPWLLGRYSQKAVMRVGISCWAVALIVLALGQPPGLLLASLLLHGIYITCFLVAGQVFVNRIARHDFRASAQGLLVIVNGSGLLVGNVLAAWVRNSIPHKYASAFVFPAIMVGCLVVLFVVGFRPPPRSAEVEE